MVLFIFISVMAVSRRVLVSLLKPVVLLDVMQAIGSDNNCSVHLHLGGDRAKF